MDDHAGEPHPMRTLIVDDEEPARSGIRRLLEADPEIEIIGEAANGPDAVTIINERAPDLVFLDVQMPGVDGFEVLARVRTDPLPVVIFVTAYDEYALRAFQVHAFDYLLKPYSDGRFAEALLRAKRHIADREATDLSRRLLQLLADRNSDSRLAAPSPMQQHDHIQEVVVKSRDRVTFLDVATIAWIEASGDYLLLHTGQGFHRVRGTVGDMEKKLNPRQFFRVHRSTIVNLKHIKELQPYFHGDYLVIMRDGTKLKLARRRREKLGELMRQTI